jgi:hypothetical protein
MGRLFANAETVRIRALAAAKQQKVVAAPRSE